MHFKTIARLGRFKEIILILLKYGFEDLVQRLEFPGMEIFKMIKREGRDAGTYVRIRHMLEELGPTFIKMGQIMSLRPDLLPKGLSKELSKLQDQVSTFEHTQVRSIIEKGTGYKIEELFSILDPDPFAAASLCQVHRGVLKNGGRIVAVKVRRPGIKKNITADLEILHAIAERLHERSEDFRVYNLPRLVRVTRKNLLKEIDFTCEARNIKIARSYESGVYVPEVFSEYCSEEVLVTEYIQGVKLSETSDHLIADPAALAKQGLNTAVKQILEDGFFHADPHPGNILISEERGFCLLDWGMVGRLTERDRFELLDLLKAVVEKDSGLLLEAVLRITTREKDIDERSLERELLETLEVFYAGPVRDINIGHLLLSIVELLRGYWLVLPADLVLMIKALITAEGMARELYPEMDVIGEAKEQISRIASKRYRAEMILKGFVSAVKDLAGLRKSFPSRLLKITDKIDRDELGIRFRHENLESLNHTLENISNRLAFSVIIAALIIGSSMIITTGIGPLIFGFPALGIIGYLISSILGLWLIVIIIRTRKY